MNAQTSQEAASNEQLHQRYLQINHTCQMIIQVRKDERNSRRNKCKRQPNQSALGRRNSRVSPELPVASELYLEQLQSAVSELSQPWLWAQYIYIDLAMIHLYYASGQFHCVHQAIELMAPSIPAKLESEIEDFWYHAAYHRLSLAELGPSRKNCRQWQSPDQMSPVNRYRVRRRFPCPTVQRCGGKKYKVSNANKQLLHSVYATNQKPSRHDKELLSGQTGLSTETITNWFKNRRQRSKHCSGQAGSSDTLQLGEPATMAQSPASSGYSSSSSTHDYYQPALAYDQPVQGQAPSYDIQQVPFLSEELIYEADLAAQVQSQDLVGASESEHNQQLVYSSTQNYFQEDSSYLNGYYPTLSYS